MAYFHCDDQEHEWSPPGYLAVIYCTRCGLNLAQSFAATQRQIALLPTTEDIDE